LAQSAEASQEKTMTEHYDALKTRPTAQRDRAVLATTDLLRKAMAALAYAERPEGIDPSGTIRRAGWPAAATAQIKLSALHK
jgi:phenylacetate-CoA ligase